ncbi:MAG: hypothetical protein HC909_00110 [Blastochloris sp.]|nr:hypothetical protein [Blastochloris sp.]
MDLSLKSSLSETIEASDNYFLSSTPNGMIYRPVSTITLDAVGRTPKIKLRLNTHFSYYKYLGPGSDELTVTDGTQKGVVFNIDRAGKFTKDLTNFNVSWRQFDAGPEQLAETGQETVTGETTTFAAGGGVTKALSARDTVSFTAGGTSSEFTSSTASNYVNWSAAGTWRHQLNLTNELINLVDFSWNIRSNDSETKFWRMMTGIDSKLTPRSNFRGNIGAGLFQVEGSSDNLVSLTTFNSVFNGSSELGVGLLWDAMLSYKIDRTTNASLNAGQSISPDVAGRYSERRSIGVNVTRDINHLSSINFSSNFTNFTSISSEYDLLTVSVGYNYKLAKEWNSSLSYTFRERFSEINPASSSSVMLTFRYDATILPEK